MRIAAENKHLYTALGLMRERGGAFARCIEEAYTKADTVNQARLRLAFGDLMCHYGATPDPAGLIIENGAFIEDTLETVLQRMLA